MPNDLVKSAARVIEVLEIFADKRQRLSAAQLGSILDYPKSSLGVLLKSLVSQGYLSFNPVDLTYFPTARVTYLGDWLPAMMGSSKETLSELQRLRDRTGETVTLTTPAGSEMRVLQVLVGTAPIALQVDDKTVFAMTGTAVGTAFLSTLDEPSLLRLLGRLASARTRRNPLNIENEAAEVARVRDLGYAAVYDGVLQDTGAIAMPLKIQNSPEFFVLAVAGLSRRIKADESRFVEDLRAAVQRIGS